MSNTSVGEAQGPIVPWWLVLIQGIAAVILGVLLLISPASTMIIMIQFLGIYWFIAGIMDIVRIFLDRRAWGWKLFTGVIGILAGLAIIQYPLWATMLVPTTLVWVFGFFGILIGIIGIIQAFQGGGWGMGILGVLSILFGLLLLSNSFAFALATPFIFGILGIVGGFLAIIAAFALRSDERRREESRARSAARMAAGAEQAGAGAVQEAQVATAATAAGVAGMAAAGVEAVQETSEPMAEMASETVETVEETGQDMGVAATSFAMGTSEADLTGNVDPTDFEEMAKFKNPLEYVEGIGSVYAGQLKAIGLATCLDLLRSGATRRGREEIAERSGVSGKLILEWVNHVDLYRVKGVGSEYADLLEEAGVDTVMELAQRNPSNLFERMNEVNAAKELVRKMPTAGQVEDWVAQAKGLPRVVAY
jgi:uncharacterized membrane protein HdeD (DUF308 family)/predicted flap endonuclease-1-like 5' DNA nuclease